jgi:hypothetical protein
MVLSCQAAEIVAWKVPLGRFSQERGLDAIGIVRCKAAPEASPFFKEGDLLWDLKGIPVDQRIETEPPLEWVVWNESSGRLVAKADWNGIWQLNQRLRMDRLPQQCRLTAEVFEVPADGSPFSEKSVPSMVLSLLSRSDQEAEALQQQDGRMIRAKGTATIGDDGDSLVDLRIEVSVALPDQPGLEFDSGITIPSGTAIWVARDFNGTKGLDLRISACIELMDGTPLSQTLMIQKGDAASSIEVDRRDMLRHHIEDKGWLITQWVDPRSLAEMDSPDTPADPFAEPEPKELPKPHPFKEVMVPEILRPWFDRPVWDLQEITRDQGLDLKDGVDFVGYDPLTQRIFIFSNSERLLDMFEQLYSYICSRRPAMLVATLDGNGQTRLVTRSGQLCRLKRTVAGDKEIRLLEIEPTIGEMNDLIDLRLCYRDESMAQQKQSITTAVTLSTGHALELISGCAGDAKKSSLSVKAEVIQVP